MFLSKHLQDLPQASFWGASPQDAAAEDAAAEETGGSLGGSAQLQQQLDDLLRQQVRLEADLEEEEEDLMASVQKRRAAFERKEEEARAKSENGRRPVGAVRAHWEMGGSSGQGSTHSYTKTYVPEDDRRCTPAKKLSDLP